VSPVVIAVDPPRFGIARRLPGLACTGTEEVTKTFRFVASLFADIRSYGWDLIVSEVSGELAYTVALERCTASCNGRPPVATELRSPMCIRREDGQWGGTPRPQATRPTGGDLTHTDGFTNA
jgi:hypothetical protein